MITRLRAQFPVDYLCAKFGVATSGYYAFLAAQRTPGPRAERRNELAPRVVQLFTASEGSAGSRKLADKFAENGERVNRKLVLRLMRRTGLVPHQTVRARAIAALRRGHNERRATDPADLLGRDFTATVRGTRLVGDITETITAEGKLYTATVIDLFNREVIGYACGPKATAKLAINAFSRARRAGLVADRALFHTDHGSQYRSKSFARYCRRNKIARSMGANYQCWDNAVAESFFSQLKQERLHAHKYATRAQAETAVREYVDYYNTWRPHGTIGGITPAAHRAAYNPAA
jgi:transposase InsO family protein